MDILVYIRNGYNEELRYAIRSWCRNLEFRKLVVVSGSQPPIWLKPDVLIKNPSVVGKVRQAYSNIRLGLSDERLSDELLLCMDDTFVLKPLGKWESGFNFNRGALRTQWGVGSATGAVDSYHVQVRNTYNALHHLFSEPNSFELHAPFWCEKKKMAKILAIKDIEKYLIRSLYGNKNHIRTDYLPDLKITSCVEGLPQGSVFASTTDTTFASGKVGQEIRSLFPTPSRYEH